MLASRAVPGLWQQPYTEKGGRTVATGFRGLCPSAAWENLALVPELGRNGGGGGERLKSSPQSRKDLAAFLLGVLPRGLCTCCSRLYVPRGWGPALLARSCIPRF